MPALTLTETLIDRLNRRTFRKIWNETPAEYRRTLKLWPMAARYQKSSVQFGPDRVSLPDSTNQYLTYYVSVASVVGALPIQMDTWVTAQDLITSRGIVTYVYAADGRLVPRSYIWIMVSSVNNAVYVALNVAAVKKCMGTDFTTAYMSLYRDSDAPNDIDCRSWIIDTDDLVTSANGLAAFFTASKATNLAGTMLFINGVEHDQSVASVPYSDGDYVEIVLDENVTGGYTVDLVNTGYYSDRDEEYREILHCPKALNPDNKLITHNTCTIFLRTDAGIGRYYHRTESTSVGQITHCDLSIRTSGVEAYEDHLDSADLSAYVRIRTHGKTRVLLNELQHVASLYRCSDADIVQHMRGQLDVSLDFWKASELEKSFFTRRMFDSPRAVTSTVLDDYVEGMGYYATAAALGSCVSHYTMTDLAAMPKLNIPIGLQGRSVRPLIYVNGIKVRKDQLTAVEYNNSLLLTLKGGAEAAEGDVVSAALIEGEETHPYLFEPEVGSTTIDVAFDNARVFKRITLDASVDGHVSSSDYAYEEVEFSPGVLVQTDNEDGGVTITAGPTLYDETLIVYSRFQSYNLLSDIQSAVTTDKGAIALALDVACSNSEETVVPILNYTSCEVYVNGYKLTNDLDVCIKPILDDDENICLIEAVLSTFEYIDDTADENWLEVIPHTGTVLVEEAGYVFNDKISYDPDLNVWEPTITRAFVSGMLDSAPTDMGTYLGASIDTTNGWSYEIIGYIPGVIGHLLDGYSTLEDTNRIAKVKAYFGRLTTVDKSVVIIGDSHRLASPYLTQIIRDMIEGDLVVSNDPDDTLFLAQFSDYAYLKERDPGQITPNAKLDRIYADVMSTYVTNWTVADVQLYNLIERLVTLTLPNDAVAMENISQ